MTDKTFLKSLAGRVRESLIEVGIGFPLVIRRQLTVKWGYSDGWFITIAGIRGWNCSLEIWLDRTAGYADRNFWYGFYSNQKEDIRSLERRLHSTFGDPKVITSDDTYRASGGDWLLKERLPKSDFGRPALEIYQRNQKQHHNFYGIYVHEGTGLSRNREDRLVDQIVEFTRTVITCLPKARKRDGIEKDYSRIENRRFVARHLGRERNGYLALLRKQKDNFICQVCGFNFRKFYGVLGRDFAEAHHKEPLGSSRKIRVSTPDDLVTVCSNCHRMLHRMDGRSEDVSRLRKSVGSPEIPC